MATSGAGDGQTAESVAAAAGTEAQGSPAPSDAPWSADLERFPEEQRGAIDAYLREKWQPHVTQIEQKAAELEQNQVPEGFQQLYRDIQRDPDTAVLDFLEEVYGESSPEARQIFEVAQKYVNEGELPEDAVVQAAADVEAGTVPDDVQTAELPEEDREALDEWRAEREDKAYRDDLAALREEHPDHFPESWDIEQVVEVISPFVLAAPDHLDDDETLQYAFDRYANAYALIHGADPGTEGAAAEAAAGLSPEQVAAIEAGVPNPSGQNASVPAEKDYGGDLGAALRDFAVEQQAKNAPSTL